jgi:hypothetical protein
MSSAQSKAPKGLQYRSCETLCADLHASIQKHPERLGMWLEDALVIHENCVSEIVSAAMDAVGNDPESVRAIQETTLHVAPHRRQEIMTALKRFKVPAALAWTEPEEEVRRAVLPGTETPAAETFEVRRALVPEAAAKPMEEIRRAVIASSVPHSSPRLKHTARGKVAARKRPRR